MKIKLRDNNSNIILDIIDYKSIIRAYDILYDNRDTVTILYDFNCWEFIIELNSFVKIHYFIYLQDIESKETYLKFFNFMLNELNRAKKIIKTPTEEVKHKRFIQNFIFNCFPYGGLIYNIHDKVKNKSEWDSNIIKIQNRINTFGSLWFTKAVKGN